MKKLAFILTAAFMLGFLMVSCEDDDQVEKKGPYELIQGKWDMQIYTMRGDPMPTDSSYWEFLYSESENPPYEGSDYLEYFGDTSGTFHYRFSENEDTIIMQDSMQIGGYFHGDWIILKFEEDTLAVTRKYPDTEWADTIEFKR
ncbi:MAG: hypothetical protein KGY69_17535 [Bacteroidales bacterium]|nr:hypothetical protein [Bacteroidales bacterium]